MKAEESKDVFDTRIQKHKYVILREIARLAWDGNLDSAEVLADKIFPNISEKDREATVHRINIALGKHNDSKKIVEVIEEACNKCKAKGYRVTEYCQACSGRYCADACRFGAVSFTEGSKSVIDPEKCKNCSMCSKACPFGAIVSMKRPCQLACKVGAIANQDNDVTKIDYEKCISCGACVRNCPFGAIADKSFIVDTINMIKESENNTKFHVYALVAPSIIGQFSYAKFGQVVSGIKQLGFHKVIETATGADITAYNESQEFAEIVSQNKSADGDSDKKLALLLSSCCPAFVAHINKAFPDLVKNISHTLTPMASIGKRIKELDSSARCVFIGPCIAKKAEFQREGVAPYVDLTITYEELEALFDSKNLDLASLPEEELNSSSYFGRIFARSGGLSEAVAQGLREHGADENICKVIACSGIEECKIALLKAHKGILPSNFIECLACPGGCVGGPCTLNRKDKHVRDVNDHGTKATIKTMGEALKFLPDIGKDGN
jgi:[FeFe] hydrogenase (group B1/B3)